MRHFPIFIDLDGQRVVLSGGGAAALAKVRLIAKTNARVDVFAPAARAEIAALADAGQITLFSRPLTGADIGGAALVYAATEDDAEDRRIAALARAAGVLVNVVDNLDQSGFITPAIVDRDPVTVAIGTEGAAPVLARAIKRDVEARLPATLGLLARIGKAARGAAEALPGGGLRRAFWQAFYFEHGPRALTRGGPAAAKDALADLIEKYRTATRPGHVDLVGAGPGDPELLTLKARAALDAADVVIHDRLVAPEILELARREAEIISVGKAGFGASTQQATINDLLVEHARKGAQVVRLKSGDPTVFGRLDEEIEALEAADISWAIVPGITAASAAAAALGQSLTKRGRNSSVRMLTGHDMRGFAEHDWRGLARPGEVAAIYMGKRTARFWQGRMLMHGADPATPVSIVENASRPDQRILATTLAEIEPALSRAGLTGPALIFHGLAPRGAARALEADNQQELA